MDKHVIGGSKGGPSSGNTKHLGAHGGTSKGAHGSGNTGKSGTDNGAGKKRHGNAVRQQSS